MFELVWDMIWKFTDEDIDKEVDEYLKFRHYLKGVDLSMKVNEEKPMVFFDLKKPKEKKKMEINEYVKRNKKSGKQLF